MKSVFGRYLTYRLRTTTLQNSVFTVLCLVFACIMIPTEIKIDTEWDSSRTGLYVIAICLGVLCTCIPVLETIAFKNRRNLDTLFFFPLSRFKMALAHYLSGWIQVTFAYTVTYLFAVVQILSAPSGTFRALWLLLPYYFLSLLVGIVIYSVFIFLFGEGNTTGDGGWISCLGVFAPYVVMSALAKMVRDLGYITNAGTASGWRNAGWEVVYEELNEIGVWSLVYTPLNNLTVLVQNAMHIFNDTDGYSATASARAQSAGIWSHAYLFAIWAVVGGLAIWGYFRAFALKRAETVGEISTSPFGLKVLVPLYGYAVLYLLAGSTSIVWAFILFVMMYIGYVIYRRTFKITLSDLICMAIGIVPCLLGILME